MLSRRPGREVAVGGSGNAVVTSAETLWNAHSSRSPPGRTMLRPYSILSSFPERQLFLNDSFPE
jgi:hypothetical protein